MSNSSPQTATPAKNLGRHVLFIVRRALVPHDFRVWQLADTLAREGYTIAIICNEKEALHAKHTLLNPANVYSYRLSVDPKGSFSRAVQRIATLAWEFLLTFRAFFLVGIDVIHCCNPPNDVTLSAGFFKFFFGKKVVFDCRVRTPASPGTGGGFQNASLCFVSGEHMLEYATGRGNMDAESVFVLHSTPDLSRIRSVPAVPSLKEGRKLLVACTATIDSGQEVNLFLEAARIILHESKRKDVFFICVGDGAGLKRVKKIAAMQGISDNVRFLSDSTEEMLHQVLSTCDVCAADSSMEEQKSDGAAILRYMAFAKPVVQFENDIGRHLCGDAALYATPGDAADYAAKILTLLEDQTQRKQMGALARARAEEYSWSREVPKLLTAYETLFSPEEDEQEEEDED